ncbi:MAG TPA: hypothetical protein VEK79_07015 [Thermoanaerobaculia bacterium]|nr:hypothetical protein [Thermoanaerobaculia bacterium]
MIIRRFAVVLLAVCPLVVSAQLEPRAARRPEIRAERPPIEATGFIRYPLTALADANAHKLAITVEVNGKPTIIEAYSLPPGSDGKALVLLLDGARQQSFDALRERGVGVRFLISIDGGPAEALALDRIIELDATTRGLPRLQISPDAVSAEKRPVEKRVVRTDDYFFCPETYQGQCYQEYLDCLYTPPEEECDPGKNPGCENACQDAYDACVFGTYVRQWNEEIEEPLYQDGYEDCGFYPWYQIIGHKWEKWWTKKTWRTVEERYCPTTQQTYQHVLSESVEYKWCYKETDAGCEDDSGGTYMGGECKL